VTNIDAWLTTVVARICLNTLRSRRARPREELVARVPDPIVDAVGEPDPEHQAMLADAGGIGVVRDSGHLAAGRATGFRTARRLRHSVRPDCTDRRAGRRRPPASWPAGRGAASTMPRPARTPIWWPSTPSSTPSSPPGVPAIFERLVAVLDPDASLRGDFGPGPAGVALGAGGPPRSPGWPEAMRRRNAKSAPAVVNGAAGAGDLRRRPGDRHHGLRGPRWADRRNRRAGRSRAHCADRPGRGDRLAGRQCGPARRPRCIRSWPRPPAPARSRRRAA